LPPLVNLPQSHKRDERDFEVICCIMNYKQIQYFEWLCSFIGSLMFIIGSYYFFDGLSCGDMDCELPGALLFLLGSTLFFISSALLYVRADAGTWEDPGLSTTACLYLLANFEFIMVSKNNMM